MNAKQKAFETEFRALCERLDVVFVTARVDATGTVFITGGYTPLNEFVDTAIAKHVRELNAQAPTNTTH